MGLCRAARDALRRAGARIPGGAHLTVTAVEPVRWDDETGAFRVSGFIEASAVLRGAGWSSDPRRSPLVSPKIRDMPRGSLLFADPPDHTRLRRLLSPAFTASAIGRLRPRITAIVDAVLDGLPDAGPEIDVLRDVSYPLTLAVIAELLDVGVEGARLFAEQTPNLVRMLEIDAGPEDLMASAVAATELTLFLTPILAERRQEPGNDFISALLAIGDEPDGLGLREVLATCILLLAAGHETTANLIANSTLALLNQPEQLPHLLEDPHRAVDELLRLEGAVKLAGRTALTDHDLGGQHITAGQAVLVDIYQANRDPLRFPTPLRLDLSRTPTGHLAFGAGPHFCLGAALARLETAETLTRLFTRYPDPALTSAPTRWRESSTFHGLRELPVRIISC
jgi:cytochrome P450